MGSNSWHFEWLSACELIPDFPTAVSRKRYYFKTKQSSRFFQAPSQAQKACCVFTKDSQLCLEIVPILTNRRRQGMPPIWQRGTNLQYPTSRSGFEPGIRQVKIPKKREVPGLNRSWVTLFCPHKNLLVHYLYWFTLAWALMPAPNAEASVASALGSVGKPWHYASWQGPTTW